MKALSRTLASISLLDQLGLSWVTHRRHPRVDFVMRGLTRAGDWQSWTVLALTALLAGGGFRAVALRILPRLLLTFVICFGIKRALKRPRPSQARQGPSPLLKDPDPHSFPSSHSACAWVVCMSLGFALGGGWPIWCLYASAIGYSRVHVGAHYPLDVLIGSALGIAVACV